jgi:DNA-directed RNA polymerase I subunit RPA1
MTSLSNAAGPTNLNQSVIRHAPASVSFGVYTDDEVRQRSVCEITSSVTYDALRNPLPRGLYDPLLGPTSTGGGGAGGRDNSCCVTCGQVQSLCPGHFGHVELCVPVMHPLFFPKLLALLRMKCLACHEFRISLRMCRIYAAKVHLIDTGRLGEAMGLDEELSSAARRATECVGSSSDGGGGGGGVGGVGGGGIDAETKREMALVSASAMDAILDIKLGTTSSSSSSSHSSCDDVDGDGNGGVSLTLHERCARRQVLKDFQSSCAKALKCANCNAFSPKVRHDQFNKVFVSPLSARNRRSNIAEGVRIRSACGRLEGGEDDGGTDVDDDECDDDGANDERMAAAADSEDEIENDQGEEDGRVVNDEAAEAVVGSRDGSSRASRQNRADASSSRVPGQDNFMNALEVEAQARLTWERQPFLCSKFFGSAHSPTAEDVGDVVVAASAGGGEETVDRRDARDDAIDDDSECDDPSHVAHRRHRRRARSNSTSNAERALGMGGRGYTVFFLRVLPVPPSRFRPPVVVGNMTVEHSQNYYLSRVIELNAQLRTLFNVTLELTREESALRGSGATFDLNSSGGGGGGGGSRQLRRVRDERERTQANSLRIWVDMQTTVNCFMDSTRDPKGTASAVPNGIRQLLEKKEGIFRKHMMGKRVNFACRSVISPDPYIGTNEIGLPLHFARTLTFPTPVTGLNVAEMRELVRRGPAEYPGAVWVEFPNGQRVDLSKMKERGRNAIAARLLSSGGGGMGTVKVGRQLKDGDMVLMNRQVRV